MSDPKSVLLAAVDTAIDGQFPYMLYGGMAAALWGEPRYTEDVDVVLFVPERRAYQFLREAARHGFFVDEDLALQQIQVSGWARLPFGDAKSPWHLDLTLGDTPFDKSALARRKQAQIFSREVEVASPEDLILYKLVSARDRDMSDVQAIVKRQKGLDAAYLRKWADWWDKEGVEGTRKRLDGVIPPKHT